MNPPLKALSASENEKLAAHACDVANTVEMMGSADAFDVPVLLRELAHVIRTLDAHRCGLPASVVEALNSGDGTYRP